MDAGKLVPDTVMVNLVVDEVSKLPPETNLLLDGFPRTVPQAEELETHLHIDQAINLAVPDEVIVERISNRWLHPASGRVYAYDYNPPKVEGKDDETGEDLVQRDDDKAESVRQRLKTYKELTAPLISFYDARG